ncbi:MAG TPA: protein kinase, partial [Rhodanobacteraceae bacterium]|nr:protein kinase [Rhodanobacteraceae bacterium]
VTGMLTMVELRPGDVVADRFRIVRLLGMGGMGVVYHAHDVELDVDVALKLLRPELASRPDACERVRQELLLARQVSSPHVVRIHDLVRHGEVWLISMDYVPGQSLERLLDTKGSLPPEDAIRIVRQLALGLAAAHQRGVVHRDLKPANVLISEDGEARITDFGVARSAGSTGITVSGVIIGTPEYLSPEQARAETVDGRSDLYALGLIFFEMLTGTLPFRGGTPAEMLAQRIVRDPPPPDTIRGDLPSFAVRLCSRLLELKPSRRFQTAEDVVRAIDAKRVRMQVRPRRVATIAAAIALLALAGAIIGLRWHQPPAPAPAATAAAPMLDIAPMPVAGAAANDADLAAGIRQTVATVLLDTNGLHSSDVRRVDRVLTELGYDADAARRQRDRVGSTLGAKYLLEIDLRRDAADAAVIRYALWKPGDRAALWTGSTPASSERDLPSRLRDLQRQLATHLGVSAPPLAQWPSAGTMRTIGHLHREKTADAADALAAANGADDPVLWWAVEETLDRSGQTAEAVTAARQAKDALAHASGRDAERARAYAALLLGDNEDAIAATEHLAQSTPTDHPVRLLLARAQAELGKFDLAQKTLDALVAEDPRNIDAWYLLGKFAIMQGDANRAVGDYLTRARILSNRLDDARMQADVTNAIGIGYRHLGKSTAAAKEFESASEMRGAIGDKRGQGVSLRNLATVLAMQGDFRGAENALSQARAILTPLGDPAALADLANDVGVFQEERGEFRLALDAYREALTFRQTEGDQRSIGESQINVGYAYYQVGEFDNAEAYWQQASATYSRIEDRIGIVHANQVRALGHIARGRFVDARALLDQSLHEAEAMQMAEERSTSLAALGELDFLSGNPAKALASTKAAADIFRAREDTRGSVEMQLLDAAILIDIGDWDGAEAALGDLSADTVANREQAAILLWRRGEIAQGRGDAARAASIASEAISAAGTAHSYGTELSARLLRARALGAQKKSHESAAELAATRSGLARYASVPLRLELAETALEVGGAGALPDYRAARAELARLPSYGRAFEIHALAATALGRKGGDAEAEARRAAEAAYADLVHNTPAAKQPMLAKLAAAYGIASASASR